MSMISKFRGFKKFWRSLENPATPITQEELARIFSYGPASAGVDVSIQSALAIPVVMAAVKVLAEGIGSMPLNVYERVEMFGRGGKRRADGRPEQYMLTVEPNPLMTAAVLKETVMAHACTHGKGFMRVEFDNAGETRRLWPLLPDRTTSLVANGRMTFQTRRADGSPETFNAAEVLFIPGLCFDGISPYSPIGMARNAIGLALAAEDFGAKFFANGTQLSGVLRFPKELSDKAFKHLRESWESRYQGSEKSWKPAILEEGGEWTQMGVEPEKAQFLETRKFQIQEVGRVYRVPAHMLGDLEHATFSNIEHQSLQFLQQTLKRWVEVWEQEVNRKLFPGGGRFFAEFSYDDMLRSDIRTRYSVYATGRQWGILSINDIREKENMNPIEGGDVYLSPINMQPADQVGQNAPPNGGKLDPVPTDPPAGDPAGDKKGAPAP